MSDRALKVIRAKLDVIFKKLFTENIDLLHDFLASVLRIPYESIKNVKIRNSEILPSIIDGKLSRMDIKMQVDNRLINIEMQYGTEANYRERSLFLWSQLFAGELKSGNDYKELKQSICIILSLDYKFGSTVKQSRDLQLHVSDISFSFHWFISVSSVVCSR